MAFPESIPSTGKCMIPILLWQFFSCCKFLDYVIQKPNRKITFRSFLIILIELSGRLISSVPAAPLQRNTFYILVSNQCKSFFYSSCRPFIWHIQPGLKRKTAIPHSLTEKNIYRSGEIHSKFSKKNFTLFFNHCLCAN